METVPESKTPISLRTKEPILFNHRIDLAYPTSKQIPGYQYYASRALLMSQPGDIVQMHPDSQAHWDLIQQHYADVGIKHTHDVIWDESPEVAGRYPDHVLSAYKFNTPFNNARQNDRLFAVVEDLDSKNRFIELAKKLGVPTPKTTAFQTSTQFKPEWFTFPYVIKRSKGTSGLGVFVCNNDQDVQKALAAIGQGSCFQVQEYLEPISWGSVLYHIDPEKNIRQVGVTEQILDGTRYIGSRGTSRYIYHLTDTLAQHMAHKGFFGCFGIDLAFTEKGAYAMECNPRLTGSVYPVILSRKLGFDSMWMVHDVYLRKPTIDLKELDDLIYRPGKKSGAIIFTWLLPIQKIRVLVLGPPDEQTRIFTELARRLGSLEPQH